MRSVAPQSMLVEQPSDLPSLAGCESVYVDVETTGLDPYMGAEICGIAACGNDGSAWYVPIRHKRGTNVCAENAIGWLTSILGKSGRWINHNVKFDAHFVAREGVDVRRSLVDTLVLAKIYDTNRTDYGLKELSRAWLDEPMDEELRVKAWLHGERTTDYSALPTDLMAEYACKDVLATRALHRYIDERIDAELGLVRSQELALTDILLRMEREGMIVDRALARTEQVRSLRKMIMVSDRIHEITGMEFTDSTRCIGEILLGRYGLPVLGKTSPSPAHPSGQPSFDKKTLLLYSGHHSVVGNKNIEELVTLMLEYRDEEQYKGLFLDSFLEKMDAQDRIHPSYNQIVRTGRMSCSHPNSQQLSKRAKRLIIPPKGDAFIGLDASQIEFRLIVHYCQDERAINAYTHDPTTDFHQWIADLTGIKRKPAKNLNFAMGYGAGRNKVTAMLAMNRDVMHDIALGEGYEARVAAKASAIYERYHREFPNLRPTSERAEGVCRRRGYVRNAYGRRRHLPAKAAHRAFNTIIQGTAMDFVKERMIAVNPVAREAGLRMIACVHDELLFVGPASVVRDPAVQSQIKAVLEEQVAVKFRVPLLWTVGPPSEKSWAEATS